MAQDKNEITKQYQQKLQSLYRDLASAMEREEDTKDIKSEIATTKAKKYSDLADYYREEARMISTEIYKSRR